MNIASRGGAFACAFSALIMACLGFTAQADDTHLPGATMPLGPQQIAAATSSPVETDDEKELNIYNWADYIGEHAVENFSKEYGIKVRYDTYDSNETLEAKLMAGNTGYDVVFPSSTYYAHLIKAGIFQKLDKSKLSNLANLDPAITSLVAQSADPGNQYAATYMWGTNGFSYNVDMIRQRVPDAPVDSLRMIFDPQVLAKFQDCGVSFLDSPEDVVQLALKYIGKDPTSQNSDDIKAAFAMLKQVRPYISLFDSQGYLNALPNGDRCIAMSWSGDYATAAARAAEAGQKVNLAYTVPKEGANIWFDGMLIPADAPHPKNALLFINYMMRADIIADTTNYINYANANAAAMLLVKKEITGNLAIYPDATTRQRLFPAVERTNSVQRLINREWTRFKSGE